MSRGDKPEDLRKMTRIEIEVNAKKAAEIFDTFSKETKASMTKGAFIFGFLHGIDRAYAEVGMLDDPDDFDTTYDFLEKHVNRFPK